MELPYTPRTVAQIPTEFVLLSDYQDIRACLESIGQAERIEDTGCLFVSVGEGEYDAVFQCGNALPMLTNQVVQLA